MQGSVQKPGNHNKHKGRQLVHKILPSSQFVTQSGSTRQDKHTHLKKMQSPAVLVIVLVCGCGFAYAGDAAAAADAIAEAPDHLVKELVNEAPAAVGKG